MSTLGKRIVADLQQFIADRKAGKPLEVTKVTRYSTPDGPMHTHTKAIVCCGFSMKQIGTLDHRLPLPAYKSKQFQCRICKRIVDVREPQ